MPQISSGGQFGGSAYNNPQMGMGMQPGGSFNPQQAGWSNPNNQYDQWQQSFQPPQTQWQSYQDVNNPGMNSYYNPTSGEFTQNYAPGVGFQGGGNAPFQGALSWTDRMGNQLYDPDAIMGMFNGNAQGSGGGYQSFSPSEYQGQQINAPGAYGGGDWDVAKNVVNVHDVIESYRPQMEAEIGAGFANAGNRLGQSGFAMSTPYAQQLGETEALARANMNQRGLEYQYDAGKFDAGNQMAAMMGKNQEGFGAWQQQGNWDMAAQGQNANNAFDQWRATNQWGFQDNMGQNAWNQQNQMQQQQMLAQILGGIL